MNALRGALLRGALLWGALLWGALLRGALLLQASAAAAASPGDAQRGAALDGLAACTACHTDEEGGPVGGGGRRLETAYGVFVTPNITPDVDHGIGGWSLDEFTAALRRGRSPEHRHLYPAFPYGSYTRLSATDIEDLWAFLQTLPPSDRPRAPHELTRYRWRGALAFWKLLELRRGPRPDDDRLDDELQRGRYLAEAVGHCAECHTPRNGIGGLRHRRALQGAAGPPEDAPDISPRPEGLGDWTADDWDDLLTLGILPDGDFVGGEMARVVDEGTAALSPADRRALIRWLREGVGR